MTCNISFSKLFKCVLLLKDRTGSYVCVSVENRLGGATSGYFLVGGSSPAGSK